MLNDAQVWGREVQADQCAQGISSRHASDTEGQATQRMVWEGQGGEGAIHVVVYNALFTVNVTVCASQGLMPGMPGEEH